MNINYEKYISILLVLYLILIFIAGLWPLNFFQKNKVSWLTDRNGLLINQPGLERKFSEHGIVFSQYPILWPFGKITETFSIELWLKPLEKPVNRLGCILCIEDGRELESLRLEKWQNTLIIQKRKENLNEYKKFGIINSLNEGQNVFISLSVENHSLSLYVNGDLQEKIDDFHARQISDQEFGKIVLGANPAGGNPWWGEIYGLAIYSDTLSSNVVKENFTYWMTRNLDMIKVRNGLISIYDFSEGTGKLIGDLSANRNDLFIPENYKTLKHPFLSEKWDRISLNKSFLKDFIINFLGFIPFGLILTAYLMQTFLHNKRWLIYISIIIISFMVSFCVEYFQIYLIQRSSSALDLVVNTLGGLAGVFLFYSGKKLNRLIAVLLPY